MTYERFFERIAGLLAPIGCRSDDGEEYSEPPLEVIRYEVRRLRFHWVPVLGRAQSVVAIVRYPIDLSFSLVDSHRLVERVARAVNMRYPPWPTGGPGLTIGLTIVALTSDEIGPVDEEIIACSLPGRRFNRIVPLGFLRMNLEQEAMAVAIGPAQREIFPEPFVLADGMSAVFGRCMPPLSFDW